MPGPSPCPTPSSSLPSPAAARGGPPARRASALLEIPSAPDGEATVRAWAGGGRVPSVVPPRLGSVHPEAKADGPFLAGGNGGKFQFTYDLNEDLDRILELELELGAFGQGFPSGI